MLADLKPLTRNILAITSFQGCRDLKKTKAGRKERKRLANHLRALRKTVGHKEARFRLRWGTY